MLPNDILYHIKFPHLSSFHEPDLSILCLAIVLSVPGVMSALSGQTICLVPGRAMAQQPYIHKIFIQLNYVYELK